MNNVTFGDENIGYYETVAGGAGAVRYFFLPHFYGYSLTYLLVRSSLSCSSSFVGPCH